MYCFTSAYTLNTAPTTESAKLFLRKGDIHRPINRRISFLINLPISGSPLLHVLINCFYQSLCEYDLWQCMIAMSQHNNYAITPFMCLPDGAQATVRDR